MPINTYLRRCRVQHAEQLLFTTDLSILEIAQRVGYDSPSRFAAMFKREKGITPRECRRVRTDQLPEEKRLPDVELQRSKTHSSGGLKLGEMVECGT